MIHYVRVGVALSRPPKIDEWRRYCVVAATKQEAELIAQQMAACTSVMPVESAWESSHRAGPVEPFGTMHCMCWQVAWDDDVNAETWQIMSDCPHHSEDTAAWAALAETENGRLWDELHRRDNEADRPTEPAECPPGTHSMFDFCPGRAICEDGWQEENPPTPETANAGGPDIDDTTATTSLPYIGIRKVTLKVCPCGDLSHDVNDECSTPTPPVYDTPPPPTLVVTCRCGCPWPCKYFLAGQGYPMHRIAGTTPEMATGAIVPDELKRRVDTVTVSSCTCEQVNVSSFFDKPDSEYVRGRTDGDCPAHGDLAQIRAFGHIAVGDRLRVNDFGVWSITRPGDLIPGLLSPGSLVCTWCDDWSFTLNGDTMGAYRALAAHWAATTEDGTPECPRSPNQRRPTWWRRLAARAAWRKTYMSD